MTEGCATCYAVLLSSLVIGVLLVSVSISDTDDNPLDAYTGLVTTGVGEPDDIDVVHMTEVTHMRDVGHHRYKTTVLDFVNRTRSDYVVYDIREHTNSGLNLFIRCAKEYYKNGQQPVHVQGKACPEIRQEQDQSPF